MLKGDLSVSGISINETAACSKQLRVLVVDDSFMCQRLLVRGLKKHNIETDVACNGKEALEKLKDIPCRFDVVLMDLRYAT